jgi:Outer membrane protein beta-barrel domain
MKKRSISLSLALLIITVMNARAQGFHLGAKLGANILKVDNQSFSQGFQFGYNVGAFAELNWSSKWGIQPEVMFNQTNYHTGNSFNSIYPDGINDVKGKLNYLSIPVLLSFKPIPLLSFQAGPQFGILMSQDENLVKNGESAFKKGDLSILAGAQLNLLKFIVGARYVIGLTNVNDLSDQGNWKNTGFQVYAGFRII